MVLSSRQSRRLIPSPALRPRGTLRAGQAPNAVCAYPMGYHGSGIEREPLPGNVLDRFAGAWERVAGKLESNQQPSLNHGTTRFPRCSYHMSYCRFQWLIETPRPPSLERPPRERTTVTAHQSGRFAEHADAARTEALHHIGVPGPHGCDYLGSLSTRSTKRPLMGQCLEQR